MTNLKSVLITGASSGIGKAIALSLARPNIRLYLCGRNSGALTRVATQCISRGASVQTKLLDVRDQEAMEQWIQSVGQLDLVLACAGVSASTVNKSCPQQLPESSVVTRQLMKTNIDGVLNTVLPAIEVMKRQEKKADGSRGRIAAIASIAGFVNSVWAPSYCASKAAVDRFMVSGGGAWQSHGIYLTSVCCGFVRTPLTDLNDFSMPGIMDPDIAAKKIIKGIMSNKRRIIFPLWMAWIARITDLLPIYLLEKFYLRYSKEKDHKRF
ncbi:SDR family NAD(P)-dependent oxidoreductase [Commensalibacter oyaizuii]|uniref:SDR family NAD(P)-dependent oxidoreductase n=1 Tax=Commensalibacter oyaizuii TaxID=3043873 RepID=A0ABT6Q223_9PROT|nr:SDR family NAD(P)-dependent oxidoreductase [Commensalibacter sp. TBRC 16381]MDI2091160.1 SDR family NAD(P)-dependent oxidoreductase [Commensalibacter sp. TBRC 16381]